jgi:translation initiation factor IF-3
VFLVGSDGEQLGVKPLPEALAMAREQSLDLVEVAPNANPPVCRVMDHGRYVYEQEQRRRKSKGKATNVVIKEMKFRPKIDEHDYVTKMKHVGRFLGEGNKVKLTIMFRGREMAHPELGARILNRVAEDLSEIAIVETGARQDGRNMTMVLHPIRKDGKSKSDEKQSNGKGRPPKARVEAVAEQAATAAAGNGGAPEPAPGALAAESVLEEMATGTTATDSITTGSAATEPTTENNGAV